MKYDQKYLEHIIKYAINSHIDTNHLYDGKPYHEAHLQKVVNCAQKFLKYIPEDYHNIIIGSCWLHDSIEDTRKTYGDVKNVAGTDIAEIVYALTNEKGKNRKERANDKYYSGIKNVEYATFVKLCDRIANIEHSIESKSRMFEMYKKEHSEFKEKLYEINKYEYLWEYVDNLFK